MKAKILSIVVLFIFTHSTLFGWRTVEKNAASETKPAEPAVSGEKMPNLSGAAAKEYLEKQGSYQSLIGSVQNAQENQLLQQHFTQTKKLLSSDGGSQEIFGRAVAVSGSTAVVSSRIRGSGQNLYRGAVYVFERDSGGASNWNEVKKLTAFDAEDFEEFGYSAAIDGDVIVVGKFQELDGGTNSASGGSAYIFGRHAGGANNWGLIKKISASDGGGSGFNGFGQAASVSGDLIIIGAQGATINRNEAQGAAYIFQKDAGGANFWGEIKKLIASDGQVAHQFGVAVAISGSGAGIVGAPGVDDGANINAGAAYIFERDAAGSGNWGEVRKLTGSGVAARDLFGFSVSISHSTAVVGIQNSDFQNPHSGAAYVFERDAGGAENWGQVKKIAASDAAEGDRFGASVAISGDTVIVGAPKKDIGANNDQGAAYVFVQNGGGANNWEQVKKLFAADGGAGDEFGNSVTVSGEDFLVGSVLARIVQDFSGKNEQANSFVPVPQGSAYVFRAATLAPTVAVVSVGGRVTTAASGQGISGAGVRITRVDGSSRTLTTGSFGYFRFDEITAGETIIISVSHKSFRFDPLVLTAHDEVTDLNITAQN